MTCATTATLRAMASGRMVERIAGALDRIAGVLRPLRARQAAHLETGAEGEEAAYFWLRKHGYQVVSRNWRTRRRRGEIDLVAWDRDDGTLCFVEVQTRSSRAVMPAEAAVNLPKQRELIEMAREYRRRLPSETPFRFDVVSVYPTTGKLPDIQLFKNAFSSSRMK